MEIPPHTDSWVSERMGNKSKRIPVNLQYAEATSLDLMERARQVDRATK